MTAGAILQAKADAKKTTEMQQKAMHLYERGLSIHPSGEGHYHLATIYLSLPQASLNDIKSGLTHLREAQKYQIPNALTEYNKQRWKLEKALKHAGKDVAETKKIMELFPRIEESVTVHDVLLSQPKSPKKKKKPAPKPTGESSQQIDPTIKRLFPNVHNSPY